MEAVPMNENRRDDRSQISGREASSNERDDQQSRDDLAKRREQQRVDHLTRREREERWPIG